MRLLSARDRSINLSRRQRFLSPCWWMMAASALVAQAPASGPKKSGPHQLRALAVVGFIAGRPTKLEPVVIFTNGNYEDATLYQAGPVPMALEPGTEYEVQREGVPQGLFTIQQPLQEKDDWYAEGRWTSERS